MREACSVLGRGGPSLTQPFGLFLVHGEPGKAWAMKPRLPFESTSKKNGGGGGEQKAESPWGILHKDPG